MLQRATHLLYSEIKPMASTELSQSSIHALVQKIKQKMFSNTDLYSFISPSAYDTAWLAMIPDPHQPDRPMFAECLDWELNSQREEGFWGEFDGYGVPTIDCLPATLACMVALKRWNVGAKSIDKGSHCLFHLHFSYGNCYGFLQNLQVNYYLKLDPFFTFQEWHLFMQTQRSFLKKSTILVLGGLPLFSLQWLSLQVQLA